jgi:hypothetical protein
MYPEFPEAVFAERRAFVEKASNVPPGFLASNAVALRRILGELENSLALELQVIHGVRRLDVEQPEQVNEYAQRFREYVETRGFSIERTSCHRIRDIYEDQISKRSRGYMTDENVRALTSQLDDLSYADEEFTDQIEPFMDSSLQKVEEIRDASMSGDYARARRLQDDFSKTYRPEVARLKTAISDLNAAGMSLVAMLGDDDSG